MTQPAGLASLNRGTGTAGVSKVQFDVAPNPFPLLLYFLYGAINDDRSTFLSRLSLKDTYSLVAPYRRVGWHGIYCISVKSKPYAT